MKTEDKTPKAAWSAPVVVDLDNTPSDVENGYAPGSDGAGGYATSLS